MRLFFRWPLFASAVLAGCSRHATSTAHAITTPTAPAARAAPIAPAQPTADPIARCLGPANAAPTDAPPPALAEAPQDLGTVDVIDGHPVDALDGHLHLSLRVEPGTPPGVDPRTTPNGRLALQLSYDGPGGNDSSECDRGIGFDGTCDENVYRLGWDRFFARDGRAGATIRIVRRPCPPTLTVPNLAVGASRTLWISTLGASNVIVGSITVPGADGVAVASGVSHLDGDPPDMFAVQLSGQVTIGNNATSADVNVLDPASDGFVNHAESGPFRLELLRSVLGANTTFAPRPPVGAIVQRMHVAGGGAPTYSLLVRVTRIVPSNDP